MICGVKVKVVVLQLRESRQGFSDPFAYAA